MPRPTPPRIDNDSTTASAEPVSLRGAGRSRTLLFAGAGAGAFVLIVAAVLGWRFMHANATTTAPTNTTSAQPAIPTPVAPTPVPSAPPQEAPDASLGTLDVATLLTKGDAYYAKGQKEGGMGMTFPRGENAVDMFREVLRREPENARATQGLARVAGFYENGARSALKNGLYTGACTLVLEGLKAQPSSAALLQLKTDAGKADPTGDCGSG